MAKKRIREDKTCLNCGETIEKQFCPECGQKNIDSRRSFYVLFTDFFATILNYDNSFWRTIITLYRSPGKLTLEYMAGRRKRYLPPIQLYLVASFLVFFIPRIIPSSEDTTGESFKLASYNDEGETIDGYGTIYTVHELDSIHNALPKEDRMQTTEYYIKRLYIHINEQIGSNPAFNYEKKTFIVNYFPKVLFVYMPVFAFFLWLFHNKKKWYYFDSGIFTLHFFSFFLLTITFAIISYVILEDWLDMEDTADLTFAGFLLYTIFYFFRANRVFFGEKRWISNLKASALFIIDTVLVIVFLVAYLILAFII